MTNEEEWKLKIKIMGFEPATGRSNGRNYHYYKESGREKGSERIHNISRATNQKNAMKRMIYLIKTGKL
jgi:hypothetical protein